MTIPTLQELFDKTATHLLTQNKPAVENGECRYRWYGLACAVGCHIKNEAYDPNMENEPVFRDAVLVALLKSGAITEEDREKSGDSISDGDRSNCTPRIQLLLELQHCHDSKPADEWPSYLEIIAVAHGLNADVVTNFKGETK